MESEIRQKVQELVDAIPPALEVAGHAPRVQKLAKIAKDIGAMYGINAQWKETGTMDPSDMTDLSAKPAKSADSQNFEALRSAINVLGQRVYDLEERIPKIQADREILSQNIRIVSERQATDYRRISSLASNHARLKRKLRKQARELMALNDTVTNVDAHLTAHTEASAEAGHGDLRG